MSKIFHHHDTHLLRETFVVAAAEYGANEAFAAQAGAVSLDLGPDPAKVNPNGSGMSLGHPICATGALITVNALYGIERINGRDARGPCALALAKGLPRYLGARCKTFSASGPARRLHRVAA